MATLPGGGPAEDGSELRSHACGVAKVEARGHAPGVGRIVIVEGGSIGESTSEIFESSVVCFA